MKQKEIWLTNLNPTKGSEQAGFRSVVIVSGDLMNKYLDIVIACPLTTKIKNYKGNVVTSTKNSKGKSVESEILVFQIRSISKERLVKKVSTISETDLDKIKLGLSEIMKY